MSTTSTLTGQAGRARRAAGTAGAVALALALSGCADSVSLADATGGRGGALNPAERRGSGNTGVSEPLAEFYDQQLRWRSCNAGLECATLRVPLDYTAPGERAIDIAVARSSATGTGPRSARSCSTPAVREDRASTSWSTAPAPSAPRFGPGTTWCLLTRAGSGAAPQSIA